MEQEIMQNANFEWLATLFVGIFSAFAGTFLGAVLLIIFKNQICVKIEGRQ